MNSYILFNIETLNLNIYNYYYPIKIKNRSLEIIEI